MRTGARCSQHYSTGTRSEGQTYHSQNRAARVGSSLNREERWGVERLGSWRLSVKRDGDQTGYWCTLLGTEYLEEMCAVGFNIHRSPNRVVGIVGAGPGSILVH